jgi:hypothetical protein
LLTFLLLKEGTAHMQLSPAPHTYPCWWLSRMIAAEFERGSVKLLGSQIGFFQLPHGLSCRKRHSWSMARTQQGMCGNVLLFRPFAKLQKVTNSLVMPNKCNEMN